MNYLLLAGFASGWVFDCKFSLTGWAVIGAVYQCYPKVSNPGFKPNLESVVGNHVSGKSLLDVDTLYIENQNVGYVPKDIEKFFPNLKGLQFHGGHLLTISASDLEPFPNLIVLALAGNNFISLPGDLFKHTPKIAYVDFDNNQIQHAGAKLLDNLQGLIFGKFRNNPCINFYASSTAEVQALKENLKSCPSSDTTTSSTSTSATTTTTNAPDNDGTCPPGCSEWIESLEFKVRDIEEKLRKVSQILE